MTLSEAAPRSASAPPHTHLVLYHAAHPLADDARSMHTVSGRSLGATALAIGGPDCARGVMARRRKRLEAKAGWLALGVGEMWRQARQAPPLTR